MQIRQYLIKYALICINFDAVFLNIGTFALCSPNKTMGRDRGDCGYVFSSSHKSENTVKIDTNQFFAIFWHET